MSRSLHSQAWGLRRGAAREQGTSRASPSDDRGTLGAIPTTAELVAIGIPYKPPAHSSTWSRGSTPRPDERQVWYSWHSMRARIHQSVESAYASPVTPLVAGCFHRCRQLGCRRRSRCSSCSERGYMPPPTDEPLLCRHGTWWGAWQNGPRVLDICSGCGIIKLLTIAKQFLV